MMNRKQWTAIFCFSLLMAGLGSSDALRGIFSPIFQQRYGLNEAQLSQMLTVSYIGNLVFLSLGGKMLDTFGKKRVMSAMIVVWALALGLNLITDRYLVILLSVFFALGASTLLNTSVNLATPLISNRYAGLLVNVFFFVQGIGTSASQLFFGRYAFSYQGFRAASALLVTTAFVCLILFFFCSVSSEVYVRQENKSTVNKPEGILPPGKIFWMFACMMGCYFIAEHGVMNRLMSYCLNEFAMEASQASVSLSVFWASMTVGRLIFAPLVQKWGVQRSLAIFGLLSVGLFAVGCLAGESGVLILGISGLFLSVLYPTMLLFLQQLYPRSCVAAKTGAVISIATIADIIFNAGFGFILQMVGYRTGFLMLPCFLLIFYLLYLSIVKIAQKIEI